VSALAVTGATTTPSQRRRLPEFKPEHLGASGDRHHPDRSDIRPAPDAAQTNATLTASRAVEHARAVEANLIAGLKRSRHAPALIVYDAFYGTTEGSRLDYITNQNAGGGGLFTRPATPMWRRRIIPRWDHGSRRRNNFATLLQPNNGQPHEPMSTTCQNIFAFCRRPPR